jgi:Family of unknown function (DUF6088)
MANKGTPHRLKTKPVANNGENSGRAVWRARRKVNTSDRAAGVVGMANGKIATRRARKSLSPADQIMALVRRYGPDGRVFTLADFSHLGSDASVRKALSRLVRAGKLHRACQGLYFSPSVSNVLGVPVSPDPDAIVGAIARRDRVTIFPDNLVAAKDVGITDAVPDKTVYLTTGNPKTITIGKNTIKIKKATWPVAAVAERSAAVKIVQALEWLGRKRALRAADNLAKIGRQMSNEEYNALALSAPALPKWMQCVVQEWLADRRLTPRTRAETRIGQGVCDGEAAVVPNRTGGGLRSADDRGRPRRR